MSLTAVLAVMGCQLEEKVQLNPSDVIAPVLHDPGFPEVITITPSNQSEEICFTWDAADMGFGSQLNYAIEVSVMKPVGEDGQVEESVRTALGGGVASTTTTVKYEDINYALVQNLGAEPEKPITVNFYLKATLGVRPFYSEPLSVQIIPTNAPKIFPHLYFIGSYCTWNHKSSQLMYDFAENGLKYQGLIDFGEKWMTTTKGGFKLTPRADWSAEFAEPEAWEDDYNAAVSAGTLEKDLPEVQFAAGGGDCKRYSQSHRFYHFSLLMETTTFTMEKGFDNISLVWNGEPMAMAFHTANFSQKFYADVVVKDGDKFHVALDDEAMSCFGADANATTGLLKEADAASVKEVEVTVAPGNYRLYIDMNNWDAITYEFNPDTFDKEEGSASYGYKGWAICGFMNNWEGDLPMTQLEGDKACWWVAKDVLLKKDYDFCFRKDGAGAIVLKGGGFKVNQPVFHYGGGGDIYITQTGYYDIYLNPTNGCCWVVTPGNEPTSGDTPVRPEGAADWSVSGPLVNGGDDIWMFESEYGYVAKDVDLSYGDEFYFRYLYRDDHSVKTTAYAGVVANSVAKAIDGRGSVKVLVEEAGKYDIYLTTACDTVYVMRAGADVQDAVPTLSTEKPEGAAWGLCGSFTNWEGDIWLTKENGYYVARNLALRASDALKFRLNGEWGDNGGYGVDAMVKAGYSYPLYQNGGDITIETTGVYDIYMNEARTRCYIMPVGGNPADAQNGKTGFAPWTVAGDHDGWSGSRMVETEGYYVARGLKFTQGQKFQFKKGDWEAQLTVNKTVLPNMYYTVSTGGMGSDTVVGESGEYDVYLSVDEKRMYFMEAGTSVSMAADGNQAPADKMVPITIYGQTSHSHLYAWWEKGGYLTAEWPGNASTGTETIDGVEYKKWTLSVSESAMASQTAQFIFNTPDKGQTSDSDAVTVTDGLILIEKGGVAVPKIEVTGPENLSSWVIVGDFIGNWDLSVNMYAEGDYYVARMVGIPAGSVFKFRNGPTWDGGQKAYNGAVTANTRYTLGDAGYDDKASVAVAGIYDIYVAKDMSAMYFMEEGKTPADASDNGSDSNTNPPAEPEDPETPDQKAGPWGICGSFTNNWSTDIPMYPDNGYYVAKDVNIPAGGSFKFRKDKGWNESRTYNGSIEVNKKYDNLESEGMGNNIVVPTAGTYDVYISVSADHFYVMEQGKKPGEN